MVVVDFIESWQKIAPRFYMAIARYWGDSCNVDDLIQDVALSAYLHSESEQFRDDVHLLGWAIQKAKWLSLDRARVKQAESRALHQYLGGRRVKEREKRSLLRGEILDAIGRLPGKQKDVAKMILDGWTVYEIAKQLEVSDKTVRLLWNSARFRLANELRD